MVLGRHGDGLRVQLSGTDLSYMRFIGTIPGVIVLDVSATNGEGFGILSNTGSKLTWQAPGSATPGPIQDVTSDGTFLLEDGEDTSKWIKVSTVGSYLIAASQAKVYIDDSYDAFSAGDVSASNATSGLTTTVQYSLKNYSPSIATYVTMWIDPSVSNISISLDGVTYVSPTTLSGGMVFANIASGASASFWVKRIIAAAAASNPGVLNFIHFSWIGT